MDTANWKQYHPILRYRWQNQITAYQPIQIQIIEKQIKTYDLSQDQLVWNEHQNSYHSKPQNNLYASNIDVL